MTSLPAPEDRSPTTPRRSFGTTHRALALLAAIALAGGLAVRLGSWDVVFQRAGVALVGDSDPHYHVLRAERILRGSPGAPWRDPALNWPAGAEIFWPPLFDGAIAVISRILFGKDATREQIAGAAAFLPVLLGMITLLLVASLGGRILGRRRGWIAAFLVSALPAHAAFTVLGRPDHHAAELALFPALLLLFARALERDRPAPTDVAATAVLVTAAYWIWQGSTVLLLVPVLFALLWYAGASVDDPVRTRAARWLAGAGLIGAALLAVTLWAAGPTGAPWRPAIEGVNGLSVAILLGIGTAGALLLAFERRGGQRSRARRAAEAAAAMLLPAAVLLGLSPSLRAAAVRGVTAPLRGNSWYGNIEEFRPLLFDGTAPLPEDLAGLLGSCGLILLAAAAALPAARRRWRQPGGRWAVALTWLSCLVFVAATFARRRFLGYMVVAAALPAEVGIRTAAALVARRLRGRRWAPAAGISIASVLVVAPALPADLGGLGPLSPEVATAIEAFTLARPLPAAPGREAVLAPWTLGHLVQYYWDRPVLVSPFGTEGGRGAFDAWAAFFFAPDPDAAEAALAARRVAWVVVEEPANAADKLSGFAPFDAPSFFSSSDDVWLGAVAEPAPAYWTLVPARLYHGDGRGGGPANGAPLAAYRLVLESPPAPGTGRSADPLYKVFGVVPGAAVRVEGAPPGGLVEASATVRTNLGRVFSISFAGRADPAGHANLRLPYASGRNGLVWADGWLVTDGSVLAHLRIDEADVLEGRLVQFALPRPERPPSRPARR